MPFTLYIRNLQGLREIRWSPQGACVLVGPNGAGKTTLLLVLKAIRMAWERGLPQAVSTVLGGSHDLRSWGVPEDEPIQLGVEDGELAWRLSMSVRGATVDELADEVLTAGGVELLRRDALGNTWVRGERVDGPRGGVLGARYFVDLHPRDELSPKIELLFRRFHVFHDPDLYTIRTEGSKTTQDRHLHSRGSNVLTLLRRWHGSRPDRLRYEFVLKGLQAAFPQIVEDLDFVEAGTTLVARFYRPGQEQPAPLASQPNGVIALLVVLSALAQANPGEVVAFDEPEQSLHPFALRRLWELADAFARTRGVDVLFATHHPLLVDALTSRPEQVYVLRSQDKVGPEPVSAMFEPGWLHNFRLGELFGDDELGSNAG